MSIQIAPTLHLNSLHYAFKGMNLLFCLENLLQILSILVCTPHEGKNLVDNVGLRVFFDKSAQLGLIC